MNRVTQGFAASLTLALLAILAGCGRPSDSIKPASKTVEEAAARKNELGTNKAEARENEASAKADPGKGEPGKTGLPPDPMRISPKDIPKPPELNPKAFAIEKTGEGVWKKTSLTPAALADRIGKAIREMKGTYGEAISTIKTPRENGQVKCFIKVQDYKTYSIQTLQLAAMPGLSEVRSDGNKKAQTSPTGGFGKPRPISSSGPEAALAGKQLVEKWPTLFPKLAFLGLTDGKDAWRPYMTSLMSGASGFKGEIAERKMKWQGRDVISYRITARRTPDAAKKLGPCEIEMVIDGVRYLPVTIKVNRTEAAGGEWKVLWQAGYNFNKTFDAKEFALPG